MAKIGFLFGAGAEECYRQPKGAEFVFDTLCKRKEDLYKALEVFYAGRDIEGYAEKYRARFLFNHRSHAYRRMVELSARSALGINYDNEETDKNMVEFCSGTSDAYGLHDEHKGHKEIIKNACDLLNEDSVKQIIKVLYILSLSADLGETDFKKQNKYVKSKLYYRLLTGVGQGNSVSRKGMAPFKQYDALSGNFKDFNAFLIKSNLKYYGVIEQDFSTIVNPQRAGTVKFWRLVNYFWSAYFSILIPMIKLSSKYEDLVKDEKRVYGNLLSADADGQPILFEVLHHLASKRYLEESRDKTEKESYYEALKKENIPIDFVLTANYTPYVKTLGLKDCKYCYLAGSVFQFEYPYELRTIDVRDNASEIKSSDLVFPYIMTQAPVKPIIESRLIGEYSKAINHLNGCDLLIILGYSLCENDNHINSLLREYITKPKKKMLVCHYNSSAPATCQSIPEEEVKESLYKKLRVKKDEVAGKIVLISHDGNAAGLAEKIKDYING